MTECLPSVDKSLGSISRTAEDDADDDADGDDNYDHDDDGDDEAAAAADTPRGPQCSSESDHT